MDQGGILVEGVEAGSDGIDDLGEVVEGLIAEAVCPDIRPDMLILSCVQRYLGDPREAGCTLDAALIGFEGGKACEELILDPVHGVEDEVGEPAFADESPKMLGGVELRTVGWKMGKADVVGDGDIACRVPTGAVKEHQDELVGVPASHFSEEERHALGVHGGQDEAVKPAVVGADSGEGVGVLADDASADGGTDAAGRPAASRVIDPTEASFVLEHHPKTKTAGSLVSYFLRDDRREFFLNASCVAGSP